MYLYHLLQSLPSSYFILCYCLSFILSVSSFSLFQHRIAYSPYRSNNPFISTFRSFRLFLRRPEMYHGKIFPSTVFRTQTSPRCQQAQRKSTAQARQKRDPWKVPSIMIASALTGIIFAIGHHAFYSHYNGKIANDEREQ